MTNFLRLLAMLALVGYTCYYGVKTTFYMKPEVKATEITWIYPRNKYQILGDKTFIYGSTKSKKPLYVEVNGRRSAVKVNPSGNFMKVIKLLDGINTVKLIHKYSLEDHVLSRKIETGPVGRLPKFTVTKLPDIKFDKSGVNKIPKKKGIKLFRKGKKNTVIVIDPGHGGREHGTTDPKGKPEKDYNLEISLLLYDELVRRSNIKHKLDVSELLREDENEVEIEAEEISDDEKYDIEVFLTRKDDEFVSLNGRVRFAEKKKADILISIHHNALPDYENPLKYKGLEVFYFHDKSKGIAGELLKSISKETSLKPRGIIRRNFALVRPRFCKAVLIECGYLIHPDESEYLNELETQKQIVDGIVNALLG